MYVLRFKWWFICAALQNTLTNQNHIKNKLIGHDLLFKNGRRFNNFDYKYNDWDDKESQKVLLDYNLEVTFKDDGNQLHNFDIPAWNPGGTTRNETWTKTTPMLFVTPTTPKAPESITTTEPTAVDTTLNEAKVTASQTTLNEAKITASQTTLNEAKITASQTTLNEATVTASQMTIKPATRTASQMTIKPATRTASQITLNQATVTSETSLKATITETTPTFIETTRVESTTTITTMSLPDESMERRINETIKPPTVVPSSSETEGTTPNPYEAPMNPTTFPPLPSSKTELIMTFPTSRSTEPELNTYSYLIPTDYSIRYPPDMTFPAFGKSPTSPDPISMMFTRNLTTPSTTEGDMVKEAHHEMEEKKAGYFTTFLLEVSKVIAMKNKTDASELFRALERVVNSLEYKRQLSGFGKSTVAWFQMIVRTMNGVPTDVIQSQATLMYYLLTNRRVTMSPEVVYLLDLADKIYLKAEGEAILNVLQDIKDYPATTKSSSEIANELMFHVVINPFKRLYGTPQEKYLVQRLEELVVSKYLHGIGIQRRKGTPVFIRSIKTKKTRTPPTPLILTKSTKPTTISNKYAKFSKNLTIKNRFHHSMWRYKDRRKPNLWKQWRSRRTTTEGTTEKSTRVTRIFKSNYVIRKYVKKNLKRRTIRTTTANDTVPQKRLNLNKSKDMKLKNRIATKSTKNPKIPKLKVKAARNEERKNVNSKATSTMVTDDLTKKDGLKKHKTGLKIRRFEAPKYINEQSSVTDEEKVLKANLYDAFFHSNEPLFRGGRSQFERHFRPNYNHEISSETDEETLIKSKIYKAFGYENDFAEIVKRGRRN